MGVTDIDVKRVCLLGGPRLNTNMPLQVTEMSKHV